jgi:hypothetical protein
MGFGETLPCSVGRSPREAFAPDHSEGPADGPGTSAGGVVSDDGLACVPHPPF